MCCDRNKLLLFFIIIITMKFNLCSRINICVLCRVTNDAREDEMDENIG